MNLQLIYWMVTILRFKGVILYQYIYLYIYLIDMYVYISISIHLCYISLSLSIYIYIYLNGRKVVCKFFFCLAIAIRTFVIGVSMVIKNIVI